MRYASASVLITPLAIVLLFGWCLVGRDRLGFRDVSHFYTPLYGYVAERQSQDWIPLWNPLDQTGIPLAGETTTALFYPLRIIVFSLPLDAETAMAWYVVLHLILASLTAWTAARWEGVSPLVAAIGGTMYAFSGSIFFLYTNPPFLIGAAWLPAVLGACLCRAGPDDRYRVPIAAICLAMMVLGGDPQTALHAVLTVTAVSLLRLIRRRPLALTPAKLLRIPFIAALLAAPQIASSIDWSRHSDRVRQREPNESWWTPPVVGSARHQAFEYSVPPWHTIELLTPNAFGQLFPENLRVSRMLPGDGRVWTPTLYMGFLGAIGIIASLLRVRSQGLEMWAAIAILSLLVSMGHFGVVWWMQAATGRLEWLDSAIGGPAWWLDQLIPGYGSFRYPGKWLSIFALAVSLTTSRWIEGDLLRGSVRVAGVMVTAAVIVLLVTLIGSSIPLAPVQERWLALGVDAFWGPLQWSSFLRQLQGSLIHTILIGVMVAAALSLYRLEWVSRQKLLWILLFVTLADTSIAARQLLLPVPRQTEQRLIGMLESESESSLDASRWLRTQSGSGWPNTWAETSNPQREIEVEASSRWAWFGRWHLENQQAVFNNMVSIQSKEMSQFWQASRDICGERNIDEQRRFWKAMRQWLDIDGELHKSGSAKRVMLDGEVFHLVDRTTFVDKNSGELAIHHQWTVEFPSTSIVAMRQRLTEVMDADGHLAPMLHAATESFAAPASSENPKRRGGEVDSIRVARLQESSHQPESAAYRVELDQPALLTRVVYQDGSWRAKVRSSGSEAWVDAEVHRVDYLKQGVILPAGHHVLRFVYQPWWLFPSIVLSLVTFLCVLAFNSQLGRVKIFNRGGRGETRSKEV